MGPERFAGESEENGLTALTAGEHTSTVAAIPPLPQYRLVLPDFSTDACHEQKNIASDFCLIPWSSPNS
jgi:hypothetical protein